jgi:hypothetical protein
MCAGRLGSQVGQPAAQLLHAVAVPLHQQERQGAALVQAGSACSPGIQPGQSGFQLGRLGASLNAADLSVVEADAQAINFRDEPIKLGAITAADQVKTSLVLEI